MRRILLVILIIASMSCGFVYADQKLQTGILLGYYSVSPLHLPTTGVVPDLLQDLEYSEGEIPKGYSTDFNDDGFKEFLVQSQSDYAARVVARMYYLTANQSSGLETSLVLRFLFWTRRSIVFR